MRMIRIETDADGICTLTLDRPNSAVNVIDEAWMDELAEVLEAIADNPQCRGVIISSGKRGFLAGADLKMLDSKFDAMTLRGGYALSQKISSLFRRIETLGKPFAAAIEGPALGGGLELALACHRRFLSSDTKAVVGLPEVNLGLLPGAGGTQRLPRMIGAVMAGEILLSGRSIGPQEALKLGLVDELTSPGKTAAAAREWLNGNPVAKKPWDMKGFMPPEARGLASPEVASVYSMATAGIIGRNGCNYPAPVAIVSCIFEGMQLTMDRALSIESKYFARLLVDPVARNVIRTTFLSRNAPLSGKGRPGDIERRAVNRLGVVGAGLMGSGIALAAARAGVTVSLVDRSMELAAQGRDRAAQALGKLVERGRLTVTQMDEALARITPTDNLGTLAPCQLVIEAVFEDAQLKTEIISKIEAIVSTEAVLASNTSSIPISVLARALVRPQNLLGLHFFSPVERMDLVEVVRGKETSSATLALAMDLLSQLKKHPVVVRDGRGFYTSRVVQRYITEGAAMVGEGIAPACVENAARSAGFPIGPLALLDEVAIDLPIRIVAEAIEDEGTAFVEPTGMDVLRKMAAAGRLGRKIKAGFYDYVADGEKQLSPVLSEIFPERVNQPDQDQLKRRLLYAQTIETMRCLKEGVVRDAADADIASVLGWGFPTWTGGTMSFIIAEGHASFMEKADLLAEEFGERFRINEDLRADVMRWAASAPA